MTVHDYIKSEEIAFQTLKVPVVEGYEWSFFEHVKLTTLYLNSQYKTGKEEDKPFRNIILPKINLEHRAVEFALKEIELFINDSDEYYKSFLVRKAHDRFALVQKISDFLDAMSETYTDYGGVLLENTPQLMGVVPFQRLAFCDQTDMLAGPICQKHQYSPDQLMAMAGAGWKNLEEVITLARNEKANSQTDQGGASQQKAKTPGRYIEVYDLEGMLPETFLDPEGDPNKFVRQLQITTYYTSKETGKKEGITLYSGKKAKSRYKAKKRDEIYGRALGRGGVEELFEPQVWVNYNEITKKEMLDEASKILFHTTDTQFKGQNTAEYDNGSFITSKDLTQVNTTAPNTVAFENAILAWDETAKQIASAQNTISGDETKSGMPFRLGQLLNQESHSLHKYRKSQLGNFLSLEVYPDWIIPKLAKEIVKGQEFLATLSVDEMQEIVDNVIACQLNDKLKGQILKGVEIMPGEREELLATYREEFFKKGNKRFLKILEGELKDLPLEVQVNITNEQRDKALLAEKLSSIFTQVTQVLTVAPTFFTDHPEMAKLFNEIIESSGLSALTFGMKSSYSQLTQPNAQPKPQVQAQPQAG